MNHRIIYPIDDNGVAVIFPIVDCGLTIEEIATKDVPEGKPYKIVNIVDVPSDGTFRNAWEYGDSITVNMNKARTIHRDRMRYVRSPLLVALDVQFQRALEVSGDTASITLAKQTLRDVTADPAIDAAQTPDELKAVWPAALGATP